MRKLIIFIYPARGTGNKTRLPVRKAAQPSRPHLLRGEGWCYKGLRAGSGAQSGVGISRESLCSRGTMAKRVAVVLAGCGVFDGSEVHEASAVLVHLSRAGAQVRGSGPGSFSRLCSSASPLLVSETNSRKSSSGAWSPWGWCGELPAVHRDGRAALDPMYPNSPTNFPWMPSLFAFGLHILFSLLLFLFKRQFGRFEIHLFKTFKEW